MRPHVEQRARCAQRISGFLPARHGVVALLFALCIAASTFAGAAATQPNAHAPLTPTLKSEIRHGYSVANSCNIKKRPQDPNFFDECLGKAIRKQVNNPHIHYFMLGLEFGCWRLSDISEGRYAGIYYFELRSYQKNLGVTDDQILKATRTRNAKTRARLAYWAKHRPASPVEIRRTPSGPRQAER